MTRIVAAFCLASLSVLGSQLSYAQPKPGIERLYILYCGEGTAGDISLWSPGTNVGKTMEFSVNCYLVKHAEGWRRHLHYGFSATEVDPLREALGENFLVNKAYKWSLG